MVFGNKHLAYNISAATIARNLFVRNGAGQTSSDHGEIALCEPGSTGTIVDNTFFSVDEDPQFVYYETRGVGTVTGGGRWILRNNTIYGHAEVKKKIAPTPAVGVIVYDTNGKGANISLVARAPYGQGTTPAIESYFFTTDSSWPQIGATGTTERATAYMPGGDPGHAGSNMASGTMRVTRTTALNVRYRFKGMLDSMTMTLIVPVPPQPVGY
jgi:hypothetical protein